MNFFRSPWPIIVIVLAAILLFGANKLPGLARNMGKSMRIFKSEVEELRGEDRDEAGDEEDEDRPARSSRSRDEEPRRPQERRESEGREYDPRDDREADRESIRHRDDDDSYRRD